MNRVTDAINHTPGTLKHVMDAGSAGIAGTAFFSDFMPAVAVTLSVIWLSIQVYTWIVNKGWRKK